MNTKTLGSDMENHSMDITGEEREELGQVLKDYRTSPGFSKLVGDIRIITQDKPPFTHSKMFKIGNNRHLDDELDKILDTLIRKGVVTLESIIDEEIITCTYVMFPNTPPIIQKALSRHQEWLIELGKTWTSETGEREWVQNKFSELMDISRHIANTRCQILAVGSLTQEEVTRLVEKQVNNLLGEIYFTTN